MDPNATMAMVAVALAAGLNSDARDHLDDLVDWLKRGGFPPTNGPHTFGVVLAALRDRLPAAKDCPDCDGSGQEDWHPGCEDMEPGDCHKCGGSGRV